MYSGGEGGGDHQKGYSNACYSLKDRSFSHQLGHCLRGCDDEAG